MPYTIIEALQDGRNSIKKNSILIIAFFLLFGAGGWMYTSFQPVSYTAKSIFYPDKEATLSGSPLELLTENVPSKAGSLGILAKVLSSRSMTKLVVSHKLEETADSEVLADRILIDFNRKNKPWEKGENIKAMSRSEKIERAAAIIRNGSFAVLDEAGFMSLSTTAYDKELSLRINKVIIQELIKFNFDKKTTKALNDLKFVTYRTDSVFRAYEALKYHSAEYLDQNKYLIKATVKVPQEDMDEKKKILSSRYLKLVEMQEQALIRTQTEKPVIQILDQPYIDSIEKPSKSGAAIVYGMLGLLFGFVFSIRKVLGKLISTELSKTISGLQPTEETTLDPTIESKDSFEL